MVPPQTSFRAWTLLLSGKLSALFTAPERLMSIHLMKTAAADLIQSMNVAAVGYTLCHAFAAGVPSLDRVIALLV